jgi:integrase
MLVKNDFGVWQIDLTVNGIRVRESTRTKDKALAETKHALVHADMLKGSWGIGKKPSYTLKEAFDKSIRGHWKDDKSAFKVTQNWTLLSMYLDVNKDVSSVTLDVIEEVREALIKLGNSGATINRKFAVLRTLLKLCVKEGKLTHAPYIKLEKESLPRHRELSEKEEADMMSFFAADPYQSQKIGLFEFLLSSGNRLSEALKLTWFDVDFKRNVVRFPDTKSGVTLYKPMTAVMKRVLESRKGLPVPFPYKVKAAEVAWDKMRSALGYADDPTFVIHSLRHTCASRLVASGMDLMRVQMWMGHKSYETTRGYAQLSSDHLKDVVNAIDSSKQFDHTLSTNGQTSSDSSLVVAL